MKKIARILFVCAVGLFPFSTQAAIVNLVADLDPFNEVPPVTNAPDAMGSAAMVLDTDSGGFGWVINFEGLTGPAAAAHFHVGEVGSNGDVIVDLNEDPGAVISGIDQAQGLFAGGTTVEPLDVADILGGLWYINIHTDANPMGEIRGQIQSGEFNPVPLPAAIWMLIPALGLLGFTVHPREQI